MAALAVGPAAPDGGGQQRQGQLPVRRAVSPGVDIRVGVLSHRPNHSGLGSGGSKPVSQLVAPESDVHFTCDGVSIIGRNLVPASVQYRRPTSRTGTTRRHQAPVLCASNIEQHHAPASLTVITDRHHRPVSRSGFTRRHPR